MNASQIPTLLLPEVVGRMLFMSARRVVNLARAGQIAHVLIGEEMYFTEEDIAEFIRQRHVPRRGGKHDS